MTKRGRLLAFMTAIPLIVVGSRITLPGVNAEALARFTDGSRGGLLGLYEMVFQGGLRRGAILALGIMPYLSARIFMRLWRVVKPHAQPSKLETRVLTLGLSVIQSLGLATFLERIPGVVASPGPGFIAKTVFTLTAGALVAMWVGEQLTEPLEPAEIDDDLPLRGQVTEGNFANAPETTAVPRTDRVRT